MNGDGRTPNELNRCTGPRNRCYRCDSGYHLAPKWTSRDTPPGERGSGAKAERRRSQTLPLRYSDVDPGSVLEAGQGEPGGTKKRTGVSGMDKCRLPTGADSRITGHSIYTGPKSVETRRSNDPQRYNPHMHVRSIEMESTGGRAISGALFYRRPAF